MLSVLRRSFPHQIGDNRKRQYERRSKIVRVFDCHLSPIETLLSFDPRSSIVKSAYDCRISGVVLLDKIIDDPVGKVR